jgi:hypothetical protein
VAVAGVALAVAALVAVATTPLTRRPQAVPLGPVANRARQRVPQRLLPPLQPLRAVPPHPQVLLAAPREVLLLSRVVLAGAARPAAAQRAAARAADAAEPQARQPAALLLLAAPTPRWK